MLVKPLKPLNPHAEEWRPTPQPHRLPPHLILPPHSQLPTAPPPPPQAVQVVALEHSPYYSQPRPSFRDLLLHSIYARHRQCEPIYHVSVPSDHYFHKAAPPICDGETKDFRCEDETSLQGENVRSDEEKKMTTLPTGKTPKSPRVVVFNKATRRFLPPRLRRAVPCFSLDKKPSPPPAKQIWRPKKSASPAFKVSGGDGGTQSPPPRLHMPPPSADNYSSSHPSNTTVMIKNIPNQLRRDFMLKFLDDYCKIYSLEYDFLYLPMDFRRKDNLGYAFVNFTTANAAVKFRKILHNYRWNIVYTDEGPFKSKKVCEISWARIQGKESLVRRFKNSNFTCDKLDFLPVILDPPRNGSDPNPPPPVILGQLYVQH